MEELNLDGLAGEALGVFAEVSEGAERKIREIGNDAVDGLASGNTLTGGNAFQNLEKFRKENRLGYQKLQEEPAIARVVAVDEDDREVVFYISRKGVKANLTLVDGRQLASYDSPLGRLAALTVGEESTVVIRDSARSYFVIEKTTFHPKKTESTWDSLHNEYRHEQHGVYSIESLRRLLSDLGVDSADELDRFLASEEAAEGVTKGIAHQLRTAMALRDQPILDRFQDEIFRLPMNSQLIILGPPGTGKTTTLIKRLGQKIDLENLDQNERALVEAQGAIPHERSWLMFTPSDLLKEYLKEAFGREQVPVSEDRIKTWDNFRRDVARNALGILKSANGGRFHFKDSAEGLSSAVLEDPRSWFTAFRVFHIGRLKSQLEEGALVAMAAANSKDEPLVETLNKLIEQANESRWLALYRELDAREADVRLALDAAKGGTEERLKSERNKLYNQDKAIFTQLARFLDSIQQDDQEDADSDEEFDEDDSELGNEVGQSETQRAVKIYMATIRTLARYKYLKKSISRDSRAAKVRGWLEQKVPADEVLLEIGQGIALQNGLRRFVNASKRFVFDVPQSYRLFRKSQGRVGPFYLEESTSSSRISPMETDAVILLMLRNARELLAQPYITRAIEAPRFESLRNLAGLFRNQVMVDEATDFSLLQLACMESLTTLKTGAFFACGDFNQRITRVGIRSSDQLGWLSPTIQQKTINVVYRQSRRLNQFSASLLENLGGDMSALGTLPEESTHEGVHPLLLEGAGDLESTAGWIAERIEEVERAVKVFPTIAVFVSGESEVKPMAAALNERLERLNLQAIPCEDGKALGEGNEVRVFDVRHIKGLEFEAVFFAGVDSLAAERPELFERYLYVGATRAATYLGLACYERLPGPLGSLRSSFGEQW